MAAVVWAADLLKKLADTGTPPHKVAVVRDAMAERWKATEKLKGNDPERHVTAVEAVGLLEKAYGPDHGTVVKAKRIQETGNYDAPKPAAHLADVIPPPPGVSLDLDGTGNETAPDVVKFEATSELARASEKKKGRGKKDKAADAEVPAVLNPSAEIETVGPKPVGDAPLG